LQPLQQNVMSQPSLLSEPSFRSYDQDNALARTINAITSPNLTVAVNALSQMEGILKSNRANLMSPYEEQLLLATVEQFRRLQNPSPPIERHELFSAYSYLISVLGLVRIYEYISKFLFTNFCYSFMKERSPEEMQLLRR